jgi:ring-1,2-phenylacetyl-CoA epoxidase subunit PaaE
LLGNRSTAAVMLLEDLQDLKDRYPARFQLVHVLSRERQDAQLLAGRIDAERLPRLLAAFVGDAAAVASRDSEIIGQDELSR